jgi:hypothetical protein
VKNESAPTGETRYRYIRAFPPEYKSGSLKRVHAGLPLPEERFGALSGVKRLRCCHSLAAAQFRFYADPAKLPS